MAAAIFASFLTWIVTRSGRLDKVRHVGSAVSTRVGWVDTCYRQRASTSCTDTCKIQPRNHFSKALALQLCQHMGKGTAGLCVNAYLLQLRRYVATPDVRYQDPHRTTTLRQLFEVPCMTSDPRRASSASTHTAPWHGNHQSRYIPTLPLQPALAPALARLPLSRVHHQRHLQPGLHARGHPCCMVV